MFLKYNLTYCCILFYENSSENKNHYNLSGSLKFQFSKMGRTYEMFGNLCNSGISRIFTDLNNEDL